MANSITVDYGGGTQIPLPWSPTCNGQYCLLTPPNIRYSTFSIPPLITGNGDFAFVAQTTGTKLLLGALRFILDQTQAPASNAEFVLRVFQNGAPGSCFDGPTGQGEELAAFIGFPEGAWPEYPGVPSFFWIYAFPISASFFANTGDTFRLCLDPDINPASNFNQVGIDPAQAHTRFHYVEL